jgi:hypothetical protein
MSDRAVDTGDQITADDIERLMAAGRWSIVSVVKTPECEPTQNSATQYFASEDAALTALSEIGGYDAQTTPREWKNARERHNAREATNRSDATKTEDSAKAAEEHARPIYKECGCTKYVGHPGCRHDRIYEDRLRSFLAGVRWARGQAIDAEKTT